MNVPRATRVLFATNGVLALAAALLWATPLLDLRAYGQLPRPERNWQEMVTELDSISGVPFVDRIRNANVFRTMRSVPVARQTGGIEDYEITGKGNGRVFFFHRKMETLLGRSEGDMIEDYRIVAIGDHVVQLEKEGLIIEIAF